MKHYGDVSKINGSQVEPVDIITFGSPCQDLSVAGKRAGIQDGERSNLFFEAIRIIKEMRDSTNGEYPKYAVWENVPGAFSSNKGHDFHAVLEALCSVCDSTVSIPRPSDPKRPDNLVWNKAGEIVGDNYSIAWRTLDAQYWGVPQRRKRIYLVADFTGRCAGEILFKPEGRIRDSSEGRKTRKSFTINAMGGTDGGVGVECLAFQGQAGAEASLCIGENVSSSLVSSKEVMVTYSFDSLSSNSMKSSNPFSGCRAVEVAKCIDTTYPDPRKNQGGMAVVQEVIALQANGIDRADTAGCNGAGWRENESYTLNTVDRHAVCYQGQEGALQARDYKGVGNQYVGEDKLVVECYDARGNGGGETVLFEPRSPDGEPRIYDDICPTLNTAQGGQRQPCIVGNSKPPRRYIIRRLIPTECARLQGFPDKWGYLAPYDPADAEFWEDVRKTHAEINGKKYKPTKNLKK